MTRGIPKVDVAGIGINAYDTIIELSRFPTPDAKMEIASARILAGGQVASAIVACGMWGLKTRYAGKIGDDAAGEFHRQEFQRAGVETHLIVVSKCASQSSYVLVNQQTGERTILWQRDARQSLQPGDIRKEWAANARLLLVDGHDTRAAVTAAQWAREAGIPVLADLDNIYPGIEELLQVTDYPVTSREFPERLTGESNLLKALPVIRQRFGSRVVATTLGKGGVLAWDGTHFSYRPAYDVAVRDTTGAGDIFHAAFAYGILQDWPLHRTLDFGSAAAALNCTATGARGGIKTVAEIEALQEKGRRHPDAFRKEDLKRAALAT